MQHTFWFDPGKLAGRSGPSQHPWNLADIKRQGLGAVLSVNDGALCHGDAFARAGLAYQCVPLSPNAPPEAGDLAHCLSALPRAYAFVRQNEASGLATLVHCHSGKDRTGLFLSYYAARTWGLSPCDALARVRQARPIAFTAPGWDAFALDVLTAVGL